MKKKKQTNQEKDNCSCGTTSVFGFSTYVINYDIGTNELVKFASVLMAIYFILFSVPALSVICRHLICIPLVFLNDYPPLCMHLTCAALFTLSVCVSVKVCGLKV